MQDLVKKCEKIKSEEHNMKRKFLEDLGIEKETIDKILDEAGSDLEKARGDYETLKKRKILQKMNLRNIGDGDNYC